MPTSTSIDAAESRLCAAIQGQRGVWRELGDGAAQARFLAVAARHRLRPLLAWRLRQTGELPSWPEPLRRPLVDAERVEAALEVVRRRELERVLGTFDVAGLPVLLLKGAAFAYGLYPEPWLRPRHDTDLLVRPAEVARAAGVLVDAGYRPAELVSGELVMYQRTYERRDALGLRHDCDLHWKVANPQPFADLVSADELLREGEAVSIGDGHAARAPRPVHGLLLACLHRVSHHYDSGDLLWLHDIHLLADRVIGRGDAEFLALARRTGAGAICARGLRLASERFGTQVPSALLTDLETPPEGIPPLPDVYLKTGVRRIDVLMADLEALGSWRRRWRLVREHLFPPADYMLTHYGRSSRAMLPALYLWRIVRGAPRWFRPF